ncbi:MAG: 2-oxo acid dehydrogenase subunit E2 [Actinomycetota bacterium]|nr:2-oxo acid dehydrogenase subunit E2 [Actinomycetota bacterium]
MSDVKMFKLPDVGEGLTEAEIVTWKVKVGDTVKVNDIIVEIETAKSLVELPCPYAGTVNELYAAEGDTVNVGSPIIAVGTGTGGTGGGSAPEPSVQAAPSEPEVGGAAEDLVPTPKDDQAVEPGLIGGPAPGGRTSVLVGYGPRTTEAKRRPRKGATPEGVSPAAAQVGVNHAFTPDATPTPDVSIEEAAPAGVPSGSVETVGSAGSVSSSTAAKALAKPPVRKLAKDLGIDLGAVTATGPDGTITRADVESHGGQGESGPSHDGDGFAYAPLSASVDAWPDGHDHETRIAVKGVRKMTAQAMVASAFTAPHVTEWITLDATRTMKMVERLRADRQFRDVKVSPLLVVARAVCLAIRRTPELNASWDEAAQEIVLKPHVHLGIAAATPRGLMVPNIKYADQRSAYELATALGQLTATAREGKTQPPDMSGGTFTITNVGVFGVDAGTPILNPGESGILCMGAIRKQPWVVGNKIRPRWVTTLALSFDHRVVDGEQGSRFLADVASIVKDPGSALLF